MGCNIKRVLQLQQAINYTQLKLFDSSGINITNNCMYSWSSDGVCWTNWASYVDYNRIVKHIESDFYLKILLFGSFDKIFVGDINTKCYNIQIYEENPFLKDFCAEPNLFQPYQNLDCAVQLQSQLSDSIVCMFGIPIYYIRVEPDSESIDYTFKEYSLHNVQSIKQLKLMIQDGQMPSSNPKLTDFDFDWDTDWEVELSKNQFAQAFGDYAFPKNRDFIYIPLMKRMWEVNSAYDEKNEGLMWRSTTWKLQLAKYNDATNVGLNDYQNIIDNWVNGQEYMRKLNPAEKIEQERSTGANPITAPQFAATNLFNIFIEDAVRNQYTKQDILIIDKKYCHKNIVVARNLYKFKNENGCVVYQKGICGDSGSITLIIDTLGDLNGKLERPVLEFGPVKLNVTYNEDEKNMQLHFNGMTQDIKQFTTYMVMLKWDRQTYNTELCVYPYLHKDLPIYKLTPDMYWFDFENPICELHSVYNNDFIISEPQTCQIQGYPLQLSNVKYYNVYLDKVNSIKESLKYTTQHKNCIINDLARPISSGHGYNVR